MIGGYLISRCVVSSLAGVRVRDETNKSWWQESKFRERGTIMIEQVIFYLDIWWLSICNANFSNTIQIIFD